MRYLLFLVLLITACNNQAVKERNSLPIYGHKDVVNGDTVYHRISNFSFINQDSQEVTNTTFKDKIYITDFFFTSCPTICPKVKEQMLRIHDRFADNPKVALLSHSIDVKYDTVERLKKYADNLSIKSDRWHLITGDEDAIYDMADEYFIVARKDTTVPGGFDHSGRLILIDENRLVRSSCDGVDPESVDVFMEDIALLLDEK